MEILQQDDQYIIKIPVADVDARVLEKLLKQIRLQNLLASRKGTDEQAAALAQDVNSDWWSKNKQRFLQ
ncbi:hypothetical protein [Spirosoma pollinicola]|uniref:Uncharacterized protein n=1 Tax=Spirosoma pollinicola TaxID=2057025 RepID=A0A2K8YYK3_9BACT|nr:hypothetical protein [Spirosoma pollinicola]AUD02705.1 hypothetical protein CWM47_13165 [Spirosoma pollinicola]